MKRQGLSAEPFQPTQMINRCTRLITAYTPCCFMTACQGELIQNIMNADLQGALEQLNKSWRAFTHRGRPMSKEQLKRCLEYGIAKAIAQQWAGNGW